MSRLSTLAHSRTRLVKIGMASLCTIHIHTSKSDWFCIGRTCSKCFMDRHHTDVGELQQSIEELSDE